MIVEAIRVAVLDLVTLVEHLTVINLAADVARSVRDAPDIAMLRLGHTVLSAIMTPA